MKLTDNLVQLFGVDKLLHFLVGAWLTALAIPFGNVALIVVIVLLMALSFLKETFWDTTGEANDILACFIGIVSTIIINSLLCLIL